MYILSGKLKEAIAEALLTLPQTAAWKSKFAKFGVIKFDVNSNGAYDGQAAQVRSIASEKLNIRYY